MKSATFTIALLASIILFQDSQSFGQGVISFKCPSTLTLSGEEEALRAATKKYLTALKDKDWDAISKLSVSSVRAKPPDPDSPYLTILQTNQFFLTAFRQTQGLMQDFLQPLEIEGLTFEIQEVGGKPCEAIVHYSLSLKANDPQTHQPAIAVTDFRRKVIWQRFECECPSGNVTEWKIDGDVSEVEQMAEALTTAKTTNERRLLLVGQDDGKLLELAAAFNTKGYEILTQERVSDAFDLFRLGQFIGDQIKYRERLEKLMQLKDWERALEEARKAGDPGDEAEALHKLGSLYLDLGQYDQALKFLEDSLDKVGNAEAVGLVHRTMGQVYMKQGEYARATGHYLKSVEGYKSRVQQGAVRRDNADFSWDFYSLLRELALAYDAQGQNDLAQKSVHEILNWIEKGGQAEAVFLNALGIFHKDNGNITKAIEYLEECVKVAKQFDTIGDGELEYRQGLLVGMSSLLLIELYLEQNDYTKAAKHLIQARYGWKDDKEEDNEEDDDNYIFSMYESLFYGAQGNAPLAEARSKQIVNNLSGLFTKEIMQGNSGVGIIDMLDLAAVGQASQGKFKEAREPYFLLLKLAETAGDEFLISQVYGHIAGIYISQKDYRLALENLNKSLQVFERMKLPPEMSLMEFQAWIASIRWIVGHLHASLGEYDQALDSYRKILERRSGSFYKQNGITLLYEAATMYFHQGRYDQALSTVSEASSLAESTGQRHDLWSIHTLMGLIQRARKQDKLAAGSFNLSIREIEASRYEIGGGEQSTERFFEDKLSPYHEMISMLVEQNRCQEALGYAEQSKSRVLLDVLKSGRKNITQAITDGERELEQSLKGKMFAAERQFDLAQADNPGSSQTEQLKDKRAQARMEFDAFRARLLLKYSKPDKPSKALAGIISPAGIGDLASTDSALLEFAVTSDKTYLFVLTRENSSVGNRRKPSSSVRCAVHSIDVKAEELIEPIQDFTLRIAHPKGILKPLARKLYDQLLKPAEDTLAGKRTLVIVPDSILWTLPFQALQPSDDRYLLQESAIYYATSLTSLKEMKKTRARSAARHRRAIKASDKMGARLQTKNPTLLVMANPALEIDRPEQGEIVSQADRYSPLPMTQAQAPALKQLYGRGRSKVYVGAEADEQRFKRESQDFDVIHLGAHGLFDDDDPMHSRILLSGAKKRVEGDASPPSSATAPNAFDTTEDGLLEAWEIMDLKLKANLVVLSACETARGRVGDGEGIVGLTWALFMAGVSSTVVSQWRVDEEATTKLMYFFHENFVESRRADPAHPRKAEALRQASLKLINSEKYRHPYYWAGFVIVGDGN